MKKLILILLLIPLFSYGQIPIDKRFHFYAGAIASTATYGFVIHRTNNKKKAFFYSVGMGVLAGLTKEVLDEWRYGGFDGNDLLATGLGGLTASTTLTIFVKKDRKDSRKKMY